jgi:HAMP domain-containing protein
MPTGLKFAYKIILLMVGCIAFTGTLIALLFALQFRKDLLIQEKSSSFTVYQAAVNYLTGHYFSKREHFVARSMDFVFSNKFLVVESEEDFSVTHRPDQITIYDPEGQRVYEFNRAGDQAAPPIIAIDDIPADIQFGISDNKDTILVSGPIDPSGAVPGSVRIRLPTDIGARLRALYLTSAVILLSGIIIATGLGFYFSRRFLAPVEALTDAARRVHAGDYSCRIESTANDEIGLLTDTFNEMVSSWVRRLTLMHRIQEWTLKVGNEFDRHRLYARLLDMFYNVSAAGQCALFLQDGNNKTPAPVALRGDQTHRPELATWVRFALEKSEPVLAEVNDPTRRATLGNVQEMVLPLISGDQTVGAVYLGPPANAPVYDSEMVATLQTLAQHAGIAVENARLLNEVAEKKRIEQEMMWARDIQKTLLPHHPPAIPGYSVAGLSLPANEVGATISTIFPGMRNSFISSSAMFRARAWPPA